MAERGTRSGWEDVRVLEKALEKFGDEVDEWVGKTKKQFTWKLFKAIHDGTPVATGRAQANWQVHEADTPPRYSIPGPPFPPTLQIAKARIKAFKKFSKVWIVNNISYIKDLDNGYSPQAPEGIVDPALRKVSAMMGGYIDALDRAVSLDDLEQEI